MHSVIATYESGSPQGPTEVVVLNQGKFKGKPKGPWIPKKVKDQAGNDVLSEANILICYMPKTELRMQSYGTMNRAKYLGFRAEKSTDPISRSGSGGTRIVGTPTRKS